jgi:hypothetical protein
VSTRRIPDARLDVLEGHYKALARKALTQAALDRYWEIADLARELKRLREENARLWEENARLWDALCGLADSL